MKKQLKFYLLFIFFSVVANSTFYAQQDTSKSKISFALRGKFLVFPQLREISSLRAYSYGVELIYNNHHCLGLDAGVFRTFRRDGGFFNPIISHVERRSYFLVDYKYNFPINDYLSFYLNFYSKFKGKYTAQSHTYVSTENPVASDQLNSKGIFRDYGCGLGIKVYFGKSNIGFDASMNIGTRYVSYDQYGYSYDGNNTQYIDKNVNGVDRWYYFRLNFFYHFLRT